MHWARGWLTFFIGFWVLFSALGGSALSSHAEAWQKVDANAEAGFYYDYYCYIPPALKAASNASGRHALLVIPNNTGQPHDDIAFHETHVTAFLPKAQQLADSVPAIALMPVFPRPAQYSDTLYTHALDRDTLETELPTMQRLDRQLLAMVDHAHAMLQARGIAAQRKILLMGFSASGMFANRFAILHPGHVRAAAIGAPGGWPIAPISVWQNHALRYPIGIADIAALSGQEFDEKTYIQIPHFFFMGDQDGNDSVTYSDGFDAQNKELIFALFGDTPVERWEKAEMLYQSISENAEFQLYEGVGHEVTPAMIRDVNQFLQQALP